MGNTGGAPEGLDPCLRWEPRPPLGPRDGWAGALRGRWDVSLWWCHATSPSGTTIAHSALPSGTASHKRAGTALSCAIRRYRVARQPYTRCHRVAWSWGFAHLRYWNVRAPSLSGKPSTKLPSPCLAQLSDSASELPTKAWVPGTRQDVARPNQLVYDSICVITVSLSPTAQAFSCPHAPMSRPWQEAHHLRAGYVHFFTLAS